MLVKIRSKIAVIEYKKNRYKLISVMWIVVKKINKCVGYNNVILLVNFNSKIDT